MNTVELAEKEEGEFSISILETVKVKAALAEVLRKIADRIDEGEINGYYPSWEIVDEEAKK